MGAKQVMNLKASKGINAQESNENQRRWSKEEYNRQNMKPGHHYDYTRRHLNFEVTPDRKIKPLGTSEPISVRQSRRMEELGVKPCDPNKPKNQQPNVAVRFVFSGDTDLMRRMAFGDQEVDYGWEDDVDNNRVKWQTDIEKWVVEIYDWVAKKYGEKNIIGFDVHLDENSPHIHCSIIPEATVKKRNGAEFVECQGISYKKCFGENSQEGRKILEQLHTELNEQVNAKWGMERGTLGSGKKHINKSEYYRILTEQIAGVEREIAEKESQREAELRKLDRIRQQIQSGNGDLKKLNSYLEKAERSVKFLDDEIESKRAQLAKMDKTQQSLRTNIAAAEAQERQIEQFKSEFFNSASSGIFLTCKNAISDVAFEQFVEVAEKNPNILQHFKDTIFDPEISENDDFINTVFEVFVYGIGAMPGTYVPSVGDGGNNDLPKKKDDEDWHKFAARCAKYVASCLKKPSVRRGKGR